MPSISPANIRIIILQLFIVIIWPVWFFKVIHYSQFPLPTLYSSPSMIPHAGQPAQENWNQVNWGNSIWNFLLFMIFFIQHIIMSGLKWKINASKWWSMYPTYERLIYNIISSIMIIVILEHQKPNTYVLFTLPLLPCITLSLIGFGIWLWSNFQMQRSIFLSYSWNELFNQKPVKLRENDFEKSYQEGITIKGVYSLVRHPMQGGFLISFIFGSNIFTVQKLMIMSFMTIFTIVGVIMEEKRLLKRFKQYEDYMKKIKYRFIPYVI